MQSPSLPKLNTKVDWYWFLFFKRRYLLAVQIIKTVWSESKKKNMIINENDAPSGNAIAWIVSITWECGADVGSKFIDSERSLYEDKLSFDLSWSNALRVRRTKHLSYFIMCKIETQELYRKLP